MTQNFEQQQQHNAEIINSRVGGLGGSDAAILLKIGKNGLNALTATDQKRLAVMLGLAEYKPFAGNAYTVAGHLFEDYVDSTVFSDANTKAIAELGHNLEYQRELKIETKLARNFATFAHADFASLDAHPVVVECKYVVGKTTAEVAQQYAAQLQWYYILGASKVALLHGTGNVEPFAVDDAEILIIERDAQVIAAILNGVETLDKAIADGWRPILPDKLDLCECPPVIQQAFANLAKAKEITASAKETESLAKDTINEFLLTFGYAGIIGNEDENGKVHGVTITAGRTTKTFDAKAFTKALAAKYGENAQVTAEILDILDQSYKVSTGAPSLTYK